MQLPVFYVRRFAVSWLLKEGLTQPEVDKVEGRGVVVTNHYVFHLYVIVNEPKVVQVLQALDLNG